jgi:hypothetical protein
MKNKIGVAINTKVITVKTFENIRVLQLINCQHKECQFI